MCNLYRLHKGADAIRQIFEGLGHQLHFPEGIPNLQPTDVRITDPAPIVRMGQNGLELVIRRWSWPGPNKRPVYNFRSEGREFSSNRCLIIADGFYEFTDPTDPKKKRKDKWLFTKKDELIFCIAGIWRETPEVGQAFTMLTMEPGPDISPYHDRQIVILERNAWADWLDPTVSAKSLIKPLAAGTLAVEQVG